MDNTENKSKFKREIKLLSSAPIKVKLFDETPDTIVIQTNNFFFRCIRDDIINISKIQTVCNIM